MQVQTKACFKTSHCNRYIYFPQKSTYNKLRISHEASLLSTYCS